MSTWATILIAAGSSTVLAAIVSGVFNLLLNRQKKIHGEGAGIRILLYDRIKHICKYHIEQGGITAEDLEDLIRMHTIYHDELKGNGYLDALMSQTKALPIIPKVAFIAKDNN